jgi:hypothetical protein
MVTPRNQRSPLPSRYDRQMETELEFPILGTVFSKMAGTPATQYTGTVRFPEAKPTPIDAR